MKSSLFLFYIAVAIFCTSCEKDPEQSTEVPITLEELNRRNVIGNLGLRLGTAVEIEAEVVSGSSLRMKGYDFKYLLKVTHVDNKALSTTPVMQFYLAPGVASVELANDTFALYKMKHGEKAESLASAKIAEIEKGYVGKKMRLIVYEVGSFHGIPNQLLSKDGPIWADTPFHFSTLLAVLNKSDAKPDNSITEP
jgi:hypothetical protein